MDAMGCERKIEWLVVSAALLCGASASVAAPGEPLVVTQLPDPDPNYVPPPEPKSSGRKDHADEDSTIDQAMEDFGRAIGQAGMVIRQKAEAKCREGIPADVSPEQRFSYEASCRYQRY
jgi:hypothetical protein